MIDYTCFTTMELEDILYRADHYVPTESQIYDLRRFLDLGIFDKIDPEELDEAAQYHWKLATRSFLRYHTQFEAKAKMLCSIELAVLQRQVKWLYSHRNQFSTLEQDIISSAMSPKRIEKHLSFYDDMDEAFEHL